MAFHRLVTPSYFGGLPGGYDLINTGAAAADSAKVGGPNAGTYFHAFGEDATSVFFNRPIKALAQNTDLLDDLLHRDVVVLHKTADVLAGGAVASIVLPAGTYLGGAGYANNAISRARLFSVRDNSDRAILDASKAEVLVTSLTLTGGDAIGGGFSANSVTLNLSPSIPVSTTYRVYYGVRENLATIDTDTIPSGRDFALIYGHTTAPSAAHMASAIWYGGGPNWVDANTNPATTVELQLDKIVTDLTDQNSGGGGAYKVGFHAGAGASWFETITFAPTTVGAFLHQVDEAFLGNTPVVKLHVSDTLTVENRIVVDRIITTALHTQPISSWFTTDSSPAFVVEATGGSNAGAAMVQFNFSAIASDECFINQFIDVPDGAEITEVKVLIKPAAGHGGLPTGAAQVPALKVFKQSLLTGARTSLVSAADPSGDLTAYELAHYITVALGEIVNRSQFLYFLQFTGEAGASAGGGLRYYGALATYNLTGL